MKHIELIDEQVEGRRDYSDVQADLVGLTAFTPQAPRAYEVAAQFRSRGIPVVMGGIHASLMQDEAGQHADALFIGDVGQSTREELDVGVAGGTITQKSISPAPMPRLRASAAIASTIAASLGFRARSRMNIRSTLRKSIGNCFR